MTADKKESHPQTAIDITNALLRHPRIKEITGEPARTADWTDIVFPGENTKLGDILKPVVRFDYQTSWATDGPLTSTLTTSIIIQFEEGKGPNGIRYMNVDGIGTDKIRVSYYTEGSIETNEMMFMRDRDRGNVYELISSDVFLSQPDGKNVVLVSELNITDRTSGATRVSLIQGDVFNTVEGRDGAPADQKKFDATDKKELKVVDRFLDKIAGYDVPTESLGSLPEPVRTAIGLAPRTATISF